MRLRPPIVTLTYTLFPYTTLCRSIKHDLLAALDSGQVSGATLDVFQKGPLPKDHPFWTHPRIFMTPHIASMTVPQTAVRAVVANIQRLESGEALQHVVDLKRGY